MNREPGFSNKLLRYAQDSVKLKFSVYVFVIVHYICIAMAIITLTTDWSNNDFYTGAIKGLIYSKCPSANVVEITNNITSCHSADAAFVLRHAFHHFPAGTIHLLCVNGEITHDRIPLCVCYKGHFFIGDDTKAFSVLFDDEPETVFALKPDKFSISTFPELTIFAQAACMLANGAQPSDFGDDVTGQLPVLYLSPSFTANTISGSVIYIDSYQNAITDITRKLFYQVCGDRRFEIVLKHENNKITRISRTYSDVRDGELVAIFNSLGLLEIAQRNSRLAELFKIDRKTTVLVKVL